MKGSIGVSGLAPLLVAALPGCTTNSERPQPHRALGARVSLGRGSVSSYAEFDGNGVPTALGISVSPGTLGGSACTALGRPPMLRRQR